MVPVYVRCNVAAGKAIAALVWVFAVVLIPHDVCATGPRQPFTILMDQVPATLNPRHAMDAAGQRIGALLFASLTRFDAGLRPVGDIAASWNIAEGGRRWRFVLRPGLKDHAGENITPERMVACLEEYRRGNPRSPLAAAFPTWVATRAYGDSVVLELSSPDPYLHHNVSALKFFTAGPGSVPCREPVSGQAIVTSGSFKLEKWEASPGIEVMLHGARAGIGPLKIVFVREETTRVLKFVRGEADAMQNALSFSKTRWMKEKMSDRFKVIERDGVNVTYMSFNMRDPVMARKEVRLAIAKAIAREDLVRLRYPGFVSIAGSLLSSRLAESVQTDLQYNPREAEELLERAGYKRGPNGVRLRIKYKTTPMREGIENALVFQEMLRKVGIELVLDVVEPAVFLTMFRKGAYQLCSSRWVGVKDGSILYRSLKSGEPGNRAGFSDRLTDLWLDGAMREADDTRRKELLKKVQLRMMDELPYFPLWFWNNSLVVIKELASRFPAEGISLSGSLEPLAGVGR